MLVRGKRPKRMPRRGSVSPVLIVVISGLIGFIASQVYTPANHKNIGFVGQKAEPNRLVRLPVPTHGVERGTDLSTVTFETVEWPDGQDAKAFVQSQEVIQGSVASRYLPARVPVARNSIESNMGESNGVVESIPRGMRAITVSVNRESAIEGWAQSGNFVDVIALTKSNSGLGLEAQVIAENIKILSAGRSSSRRDIGSTAPKAPDTVTLLCEQEDCLKIRMASRIGSITFSLRGIQDVGPATSVALTQQKLLGNSKKVRAKRFDYNGFAKGPGGEVYLLTRESAQWVKKGEETSDSTKLTTRRMLERARMTAEAGTYD